MGDIFGSLFAPSVRGSSVARLYTFTPAAAAVAVHAALAGTAVSNAFPGPFTSPVLARTCDVIFGAGWDGGNVTLTGTFRGVAQVEIFVAVAGTTVAGVKPFDTTTSAAKAAVGINAATATIQTGGILALPALTADAFGILTLNSAQIEAVTISVTNQTWVPTTAPNGARVFLLLQNVVNG